MKRVLLLFLVIIAVLLIRSPYISNSQQDMQDASSDEVIVKYKTLIPEYEKEKIRKNLKTSLKQKIQGLNIDIIKIHEGTVEEKIRQYKANPFVAYAEPNFKAQAFGITNDASLSQQWGLFKINAANYIQSSAWDETISNPTVKIAILDTGIDESHPELSGKIISSTNFTSSPTNSDLVGHGTHVAGIAAASTNNGSGIAGTGYNTTLLNGKVLGDNGSGYYSWIANGIVWAADQGAQVINLSLGGTSSSLTLQDAVNYAWNKGSVIVAAAGNTGNSNLHYPAYYQNAIAVAATDENDIKASSSTYGNWVDVAAPGVSIYSTYKGNSYISKSGTSMATPFVAGTSALIWAKGLCTSNICVRDQLEKTADQISGTGTYWTWGRINAYNAVSGTAPTPTATPTAALTNTPTPTLPAPTATPTPIPPTNTLTPSPTPTPIISTPTPTPTQTLIDTTKPTISITYPANGATVPRKTNISVTANANDNREVTKVKFYRNNDRICTITVPTADKKYACTMYTASFGIKVTYKATAYDDTGNSATSTVVVTAK